MEHYSSFGVQARSIMLQKKITIKALAGQLGITSSYLSDILKGARPGKKYRTEIAVALGIDHVHDHQG